MTCLDTWAPGGTPFPVTSDPWHVIAKELLKLSPVNTWDDMLIESKSLVDQITAEMDCYGGNYVTPRVLRYIGFF